MRNYTVGHDRLEDRIASLETATRAELIETWAKLYKAPPFKGIRNQTLVRGIAYQMQIKAMGGLKPSVSRELLGIAKGEDVRISSRKRRHSLTPGSKLIREWNERFNGTLHREILNAEWFHTIKQAQVAINIWVRQYNHIRPHHALNMRPPVPETTQKHELEKNKITGTEKWG